MLKIYLWCCLVILAVVAAPQGDIVRNENTSDGNGAYKFAYETSDGSFREEQGELVNAGTDDETLVVVGKYGYKGADGKMYVVNYTADENGFQPEGDHLPKSPKMMTMMKMLKAIKKKISNKALASLVG